MKIEAADVILYALIAFVICWLLSRPFIAKRVANLIDDSKKQIYTLFNLPLIIGVCLLSFAHGANDVGPLAAIVSTMGNQSEVAAKVSIPLWVMIIGAFGIALGLALFGPKLIATVGEKITRLNSPRAYCVALSSAVTVLIAIYFGLPVSSTHIAIGAIFGVGFLREFLEAPKRKNKASSKADVYRKPRQLVRRRFVFSIAAAWVITVPASAFLSASIYFFLNLL